MKTAEMLASPVLIEARPEPALVDIDLRGRLAAYLALTKPRIAFMVLVTVAVGFVLGAPGSVRAGQAASDPARHGAGGGWRERLEHGPGARA